MLGFESLRIHVLTRTVMSLRRASKLHPIINTDMQKFRSGARLSSLLLWS